MNIVTGYAEECISCGVKLGALDDDPNGEHNPICVRCRSEEEHDFDLEPNVEFDRSGARILN